MGIAILSVYISFEQNKAVEVQLYDAGVIGPSSQKSFMTALLCFRKILAFLNHPKLLVSPIALPIIWTCHFIYAAGFVL